MGRYRTRTMTHWRAGYIATERTRESNRRSKRNKCEKDRSSLARNFGSETGWDFCNHITTNIIWHLHLIFSSIIAEDCVVVFVLVQEKNRAMKTHKNVSKTEKNITKATNK